MTGQFWEQPQKKNKWSRKHARQHHDTQPLSPSLKRLRHYSKEENESFIAADSASSSDTDMEVCLLSVS